MTYFRLRSAIYILYAFSMCLCDARQANENPNAIDYTITTEDLPTRPLASTAPHKLRRLFQWESYEQFLQSFEEGGVVVKFFTDDTLGDLAGKTARIINTGMPKVLIIGAGLAYDDRVPGSTGYFPQALPAEDPYRIRYYPMNAFLIDADGDQVKADLKVDLKEPMGVRDGIPIEFLYSFDFVVLEYIPIPILRDKNFIKIYGVLKPGGSAIFNSPIDESSLEVINKKSLAGQHELRTLEAEEDHEIVTVDRVKVHCLRSDRSHFYISLEDNASQFVSAWLAKIGFDQIDLVADPSPYWYSSLAPLGHIRAKKPLH